MQQQSVTITVERETAAATIVLACVLAGLAAAAVAVTIWPAVVAGVPLVSPGLVVMATSWMGFWGALVLALWLWDQRGGDP